MQSNGATNAEVWLRFYLEHRRALTAYATALIGSAEGAHDLIQDVLLRLVHSGVVPRNRRAYVLRCLRTTAADWRTARRCTSLDEAGLDPAFLDDTAGDAAERELVALAQAALRALPTVQREAIVLRVYAGLTIQEASEVLDRPAGSIASAYARGIAALREALGTETEHGRRYF